MKNWKRYTIVLTLHLLVGFFLSANCEGERCMIIVFVIAFNIAAILAYIPYLFFKARERRLQLFILPSLLLVIFCLLAMVLGSNIHLSLNNALPIIVLIVPNTLLQLIFYFVERHDQQKSDLN